MVLRGRSHFILLIYPENEYSIPPFSASEMIFIMAGTVCIIYNVYRKNSPPFTGGLSVNIFSCSGRSADPQHLIDGTHQISDLRLGKLRIRPKLFAFAAHLRVDQG